MANRRINPRRISRHFSYTIEEAADALGTHRNTVRGWVKAGLPAADDQRPMILAGASILDFLNDRIAARKRPLKPSEFYCLKCRVPTRPDGDMADFTLHSPTLGTLSGLCPGCGTLVHRRVAYARLAAVAAGLDVHILPGTDPPKREAGTHSQL